MIFFLKYSSSLPYILQTLNGRLAFSFFLLAFLFLFFSVMEINCNDKSPRGKKRTIVLDIVQIQNKKDGHCPKSFSKPFDATGLSHNGIQSQFQFLKYF